MIHIHNQTTSSKPLKIHLFIYDLHDIWDNKMQNPKKKKKHLIDSIPNQLSIHSSATIENGAKCAQYSKSQKWTNIQSIKDWWNNVSKQIEIRIT